MDELKSLNENMEKSVNNFLQILGNQVLKELQKIQESAENLVNVLKCSEVASSNNSKPNNTGTNN